MPSKKSEPRSADLASTFFVLDQELPLLFTDLGLRGGVDSAEEVLSQWSVARFGEFDRGFNGPVVHRGAGKFHAVVQIFQLRGFIGAGKNDEWGRIGRRSH